MKFEGAYILILSHEYSHWVASRLHFVFADCIKYIKQIIFFASRVSSQTLENRSRIQREKYNVLVFGPMYLLFICLYHSFLSDVAGFACAARKACVLTIISAK